MAMLIMLGRFLEFTEGARHVLAVIWAGGILGCAMHGVFRPRVLVRGASGAIYAVMWSQLSLLALNWREMPLRFVRLLLCVMLLTYDVTAYVVDPHPGLSYSAHCFGALAGVSVALVLGRNVRLRRRDLVLKWLGVFGYAALVAVAFAWRQTAAAVLAALLFPILALRAAWYTRRALVQKRTVSQKPAAARVAGATRGATRGQALLRHGTARVLNLLAVRVPARRPPQWTPPKPVKV